MWRRLALGQPAGTSGGSADGSDGAAVDRGQELARTRGCAACHGADGQGGLGPAWTDLAGSTVTLEDGSTVTADDAYLTESIVDPTAKVVDGFAVTMPKTDLSDAEVADLVAYIESLTRMRRILAAAAAAIAIVACGGGERDLVGVTRDPEPQVDAVALPDVADGGAPFEFRAPADGLLIVYFGYTNCPDVCPTTMADLKVALDDIGTAADRVEVAMVTVDPERDTPVLADYIQGFFPGAHAIATDDPAALQSVTGQFGVVSFVTTAPDGDIEVAHSSNLFAVDDAGRLVLTWSVGGGEGTARADDLAGDIRQLLDG